MKIQLTISLLVSDRMETLGKCLASLKPLLLELDSELIIVYTGKSAEALELARQYAAQVIPFTWCDDFAKARNAGLEQARGEWFLYLDDDEWFEDTNEIIHFFKSGEYRNYQTAYYVQRNYADWEGKSYTDCFVGRMCRLTPETRFSIPIHEYLDPFPRPSKNFRCFVHHFGYIGKAENGQDNSRPDRNVPMLLENLKTGPQNEAFHACMQLAQEYGSMKEYDKATEYCEKGLELAQKSPTIYEPEMWMQVNFPVLISFAGDNQRALEEGERLLNSPRTPDVAVANLCTILANLCHTQKEYQKGSRYVRSYRRKMEYLWEHPEEAALQKCININFDFAEGRAVLTYIYGLEFALETGDLSLMKQILTWIPWDDKVRVSRHYTQLEEWKTMYHAHNDAILEGFSALRTEDIYVNLQKAYHAEKQGQLPQAEGFWKLCAADCPAWLLWQPVQMAVRDHFSLEPLMERISLDIWEECARALAEQIPVSDMQSFYQDIQPLMEAYPLCAEMLDQYFLEKQLSQGLLEHSQLIGLLHRYCESAVSSAKALYRDEVLSAYCSSAFPYEAPGREDAGGRMASGYALPSQYRFAFLMDRFLGFLEQGKLAKCIPILKEAYRIYPKMTVVIGQLTRYLSEQIENPPQVVPEEFIQLGGQVKQALVELIGKKQWQEAYGVVERLVALLPDDLEILRLKQQILRGDSLQQTTR